jgi:hypothetical protein
MRLCVVHCKNIMQTVGMCAYRGNVVYLTWEYYVYRGNAYRVNVMHTVGIQGIHTVGMLCLQWECYAYRAIVMRIVGMLRALCECYTYVAWECYAYCWNFMRMVGMLFAPCDVMCTVEMLCVPWERYTYRGNVMRTVGTCLHR